MLAGVGMKMGVGVEAESVIVVLSLVLRMFVGRLPGVAERIEMQPDVGVGIVWSSEGTGRESWRCWDFEGF